MSVVFVSITVLSAASLAGAGSAEEGAKIFVAQKCSLCHSVAGKGNAKGALDAVGTKLTASEIRQWITSPKEMTAKTGATRKPPMKTYDLSKEQVDALTAYLQTLKRN